MTTFIRQSKLPVLAILLLLGCVSPWNSPEQKNSPMPAHCKPITTATSAWPKPESGEYAVFLQTNVHRIQVGMSAAEVRQILGPPRDLHKYQWKDVLYYYPRNTASNVTVYTFVLDGNGRVASSVAINKESKDYWTFLEKNIEGVTNGMPKSTVMRILGPPEKANFIPESVMQYSVYSGVVSSKSASFAVFLDEKNKVREVKRFDSVLGPPPILPPPPEGQRKGRTKP